MSASKVTEELFDAAKKGDVTKMEQAIKNGAKLSHYYAYNVTAMSNAVESGNVDAVKCLVKHGMSIHTCVQDIGGWDQWYDDDSMLHLASKQGNLEMVKYLLSQGADTSKTNIAGQTAQQVAANSQIEDTIMFKRII